jgi:serine/threonine-protein kinase
MSPEQATRSRAITERSDLFAAGLLVYYALTGHLPFDGAGESEIMVALVRRPHIPLRKVRRGLPRALDLFISRALAKHPDARFGSAREMRAALDLVRGEATTARPSR